MLVVISDLHFCDDTAYSQKIDSGAFALLLGEIGHLAAKCGAKRVEMILLGDVFDLLRTTAWLDLPISERPWGSAAALDPIALNARVLSHADSILEKIRITNQEALAKLVSPTLTGIDAHGRPYEIAVKRFWMTGNHDRLALHSPSLTAKMLAMLDASPVGPDLHELCSEHTLIHPDYGLLARHGHEWDSWNFERFDASKVPSDYEGSDYLPAPIGDPITTELVARLPHLVFRTLSANRRFTDESDLLNGIVSRLQRIEDVRPNFAAFRWISYEVGRWHRKLADEQKLELARALSGALNDAVHTAATDFLKLEYYRAWRERHGTFLSSATAFHGLLEFLRVADPSRVSDFGGRISRLAGWVENIASGEDNLAAGARREDLSRAANKGLRFVVYGHSHDAKQVALKADQTQDIYLNSGTWRGRQFEAASGDGFVGWEQCTWLAFYRKDEPDDSGRTGPAFESWTGQRKFTDHGDWKASL